MSKIFPMAHWIWQESNTPNAYVLFCQSFQFPQPVTAINLKFSASYYADIYINGLFVSRGPIPGDPAWCQYEEITHPFDYPLSEIQLCAVVHHSDCVILSQLPAPPGFIAAIEAPGQSYGTNANWRCLALKMWQPKTFKRGWALDYFEDYDARQEPDGWNTKLFSKYQLETWPHAVPVPNANAIWKNYQKRMTPLLNRRLSPPPSVTLYQADPAAIVPNEKLTAHCDSEPLKPIQSRIPANWDQINSQLSINNAVTLDLNRQCIGYYYIELDAPAGVVIDITAAETAKEDGRPWPWRRDIHNGARYTTKAGPQTFQSYTWNGFRYLHLVFRGTENQLKQVLLHRAGCLEKRADLTIPQAPATVDNDIKRIYDLCAYTLAINAQEHLIDCPTREQLQYWGDAVFIAECLWKGFHEKSYMEWYLECFIHVPFYQTGLFSSVYPGDHAKNSLVDYNLIPAIGQMLYHQHTGTYYRLEPWLQKALQLNQWFEKHLDKNGLVAFDNDFYVEKYGIRNFIDHPGIGWHNFDHPGIDRQGISCPLNCFYCLFIEALSQMAKAAHQDILADKFQKQAHLLKKQILTSFYDGEVFRDALHEGKRSAAASWQTNALAVYCGLIEAERARAAMRHMIDGYDRLCRCTPYFHFYFLEALGKTGLISTALDLIKRLWLPMLQRDTTTTWETFGGDHRDSLCHPWSTAPLLFIENYCRQ